MKSQIQVDPVPYLQINNLIFQKEYLNPTGSVKDRGISNQISYLNKTGVKSIVISSSGNAAISAAYFCNQFGISLTVFLSPKISLKKLALLKKSPISIQITPRPISSAFRFAKKTHSFLLRPSQDPQGTAGYQSLGRELAKLKTSAIFFPVSSGTTLVGAYEGYSKISKTLPQFHIVQTTSCHPLASRFDQNFTSTKSSLADSLVAKSVPRKHQVLDVVKKTQGSGWVIPNLEIKTASDWLSQHRLSCSFEGAAALAAIRKAQSQGWSWPQPVVCLLTGKKY